VENIPEGTSDNLTSETVNTVKFGVGKNGEILTARVFGSGMKRDSTMVECSKKKSGARYWSSGGYIRSENKIRNKRSS